MSTQKKTLHSLSLEELGRKASELKEQLFKMRLQKTMGQLGNTALLKLTRKELARVNTLKTQKANIQVTAKDR